MSHPTTPLVHTPYSNAYDLVPYGSEEAGVKDCPTPKVAALLPEFLGSSGDGMSHTCSSCSCCDTPTPEPTPATPSASAVHRVQHQYLTGQCEFLEFTSEGRIESAPISSRLFKLFIGHMKFETSAPELRWILQMLTGVTCGKIEARGLGCFMVFFQNYEEMWKVKGLHKRALFDHSGVWFCRNEQQEAVMQHYATTYLPRLPNNCHLPKGLMVIDEETSRKKKNNKNKNKNKSGEGATTTACSAKKDTMIGVPTAAYSRAPPVGHTSMVAPGYVPAPVMTPYGPSFIQWRVGGGGMAAPAGPTPFGVLSDDVQGNENREVIF